VLRVEGDGGKRAYIGMGFAERGDAFDFQVSKKHGHQALVSAIVRRLGPRCSDARGTSADNQVALQSVAKRSSNPSSSSNPSEPPKPAAPPKDYSLKEGQTFTIKIPGKDGKKIGKQGGSTNLLGSDKPSGGGGLFSLPPPPPPGRR
jgi:hypothetical protein